MKDILINVIPVVYVVTNVAISVTAIALIILFKKGKIK